MLRYVTVPLFVLSLAASLPAGEFNPTLNIGDPAPAWNKLPGTDGKQHSLADLKQKEVVVVAFTCNSCPYAVDYEDRMIAFANKHCGPQSKVALVAINVNKIDEDSLPKMQERAKEKKFPFPYLFDETQQIAKDFGATFTPEFFVLGKDRKIVYMGALDDKTNPAEVKINYLEQAVAAALEGKLPETKKTAARGCLVRYERKRGKK
jgi:peroxiredoxin